MPGLESPSFITTCEEDEEGNLILNFPDELLEAMGWGEGTTLDISVIGERIVLREVQRSDLEETGFPVE
jgi:bifunctional DNA-binding transcriptional regulator/antitoxin component of YhaV-PrlF toxin-antitoxin module